MNREEIENKVAEALQRDYQHLSDFDALRSAQIAVSVCWSLLRQRYMDEIAHERNERIKLERENEELARDKQTLEHSGNCWMRDFQLLEQENADLRTRLTLSEVSEDAEAGEHVALRQEVISLRDDIAQYEEEIARLKYENDLMKDRISQGWGG